MPGFNNHYDSDSFEAQELLGMMQNTLAENATNFTWKSMENFAHYVFVPFILYKLLNKVYSQQNNNVKHGAMPMQQATIPVQPVCMPMQQGCIPLQQAAIPMQQMMMPIQKSSFIQNMIKGLVAEGMSDLLHSYWAKTALWEAYKATGTSFLKPMVGRWFLGLDLNDDVISSVHNHQANSYQMMLFSPQGKEWAFDFGQKVVESVEDPEKLKENMMSFAQNGLQYGVQAGVNGVCFLAKAGLDITKYLAQSALNATFMPMVNAVDDKVWNASRYAEQKIGFISADNIHQGIYITSAIMAGLSIVGCALAYKNHVKKASKTPSATSSALVQQFADTLLKNKMLRDTKKKINAVAAKPPEKSTAQMCRDLGNRFFKEMFNR